MASRDFSGADIVSALRKFGFHHDRTTGDHAILVYEHPETGEKRTVTVPLHDRVRIGTLQSIADQCGADDFHSWCEWIDEHC
ncbi:MULTISPECIES: type II toxin-antitoxin system HicA family toxin [Halobacterium]|uniref:type II toxin-antitoxin system HicA family toxin n=1 Tax=Halobacterium TaxID=2239 RepID=UPI00073E69D6|nr:MULTISPECIES: type II toxin-antitoxin system HicA family toxin [Halobacterium]MCG1003008.1 type II toxin-antitoxin system HicA family toxin [Halobacterium noricense]